MDLNSQVIAFEVIKYLGFIGSSINVYPFQALYQILSPFVESVTLLEWLFAEEVESSQSGKSQKGLINRFLKKIKCDR